MTPAEAPEPRAAAALPGRFGLALYGGAVLAVSGFYLWLHSALGLGYPMPWPDEGSFLWQALAFGESGSLLAPQLNPDRHILWMPPGYMIVQGITFELTGFSLAWARMLSALAMVAGAGLLAMVFWRLRHPFAALFVWAAFLLSPIAQLVGNVARMESLVFFGSSLALLCIQRGRLYVGLSLLSLLPLVHPNGLYFCLGGGVYFALCLWREGGRLPPSRGDWLFIAGALLSWSIYGLYVLAHWEAFLSDMAFQLSWKGALGGGAAVASKRVGMPSLWAPILMGAVASAASWRERLPSRLLGIYAAPLLLLAATSPGWLYDIYLAMAWLFVAVFSLEAAASVPRSLRASTRAGLALGLGMTLALLGTWAARESKLLMGSERRATTVANRTGVVPYLAPDDEATIRAYLEARAAERPVTIVFYPWAEALLFVDLESDRLRLAQPTFHELHADIVIVHESRHIPGWVRRGFEVRAQLVQGVERPVAEWDILRRREAGERWRVYQRSTRPAETEVGRP